MRLTKEALLASDFSAVDDPRYSINGIMVEADGSTVATDGHRLIKYTPAGKPDPKAPVLEPFILSTEACKQAIRLLKRTTRLDLDVDATNKNGRAEIRLAECVPSDDPAAETFPGFGGVTMNPEKLEGAFPRYENVIPKGEPLATVGLSVSLVASTFATLKRQGFNCARVSFPKPTKTAKTADLPIRIEAKSDDGKATVVLMPMHL